MNQPRDQNLVKAWDLPTRLFKWLLVILVVLAWVSNKYGAGFPTWHKANGIAILVLVVFRIAWGIKGSSTARFGSFVAGPKALFSYVIAIMKGEQRPFLGHNPLGGWMIIALLGALGLQAILGLYSADEDRLIIEGPLAKTVSDAAVDQAAHYHRLGFDLIIILATVHIAANVIYDLAQKHRGHIRAMVTGTKPRASFADRPEIVSERPFAALIYLIGAVAIVLGGIALLGGNPIP
jgi:cytochrome b